MVRNCTKTAFFCLLISWLCLGQARAEAQGGVGIYLDFDPPGSQNLVVFSVSYKSPADNAKIVRGDRLLKVNGQEITGKPLPEVAAMIGGPVGSTVNLTMMREGQSMELALVRAPLRAKGPLALPPPSMGGPGEADPYTFTDLERQLVKMKIVELKTDEERDRMLALLTSLKDKKITAAQFLDAMKKQFPSSQ